MSEKEVSSCKQQLTTNQKIFICTICSGVYNGLDSVEGFISLRHIFNEPKDLKEGLNELEKHP